MRINKKEHRFLQAVLFTVLCLAGCLLADRTDAFADVMQDGRKVVNVSNIDEFLNAIAPDTEIVMAPGTYNITEAAAYQTNVSGRYYSWENYYIPGEYELRISFADNLKITGFGAELVTVPRSVNVLSFYGCYGVVIEGLTAGHTEAAQACDGGVIRLESCNRANIDGCNLYGCGTDGVIAYACNNLTVTNTEIHHCSYAGISVSDCSGVYIGYCKIHDCGEKSAYGNADAAFTFYTVEDAVTEECEISGNVFYNLVSGWNLRNISFSDMNIHDNRFISFVSVEGDVSFRAMALSGNTIDGWGVELSGGTIVLDGVRTDGSQLNDLWGDQLSSSGVGVIEAVCVAIDRMDAAEVHVSTTDEFLAAIASDTVIYIDVPQLRLTDASTYGWYSQEDLWGVLPDFGSGNYVWLDEYDGFQLCIGNVKNFHIVGGEIITSPRYANVLSFYNCSDISLENVRLGHSPEEGSCAGGVLSLQYCTRVILESCDLYGCGILGVEAYNVNELYVQNTVIHDCSYGAAQLMDSDTVAFLGCTVRNCPDPQFTLQNCTGFSWENTLMDSYCNFNVTDDLWYDPAGYLENLQTETERTASVVQQRNEAAELCGLVAFAYFHGDMWLVDNYAAPGYAGIREPYQDSENVWFDFPEGVKSLSEIAPKDLSGSECLDGIYDITGDEDGYTLRTVTLTYRTAPDAEPSRLYICLVRQDGVWWLQSFTK